MTNPLADITDPVTLLAMVQDGVKCERCKGRGIVIMPVKIFAHKSDPPGLADLRWPRESCPTCNGTGHTPLSSPDLDALAACWCEGEWVRAWGNNAVPHFWQRARAFNDWEEGFVWDLIPDYTTSPDAAMQLLVKYKLQPKIIKLQGKEHWYVLCGAGSEDCSVVEGATIEALCHALTEAALVAALTEAMEGGSDAGD